MRLSATHALRSLPINELERPDGTGQPTVATFDMYVALPAHVKGTHMSRFVAIAAALEAPLSVAGFRALMERMLERLEAGEELFPGIVGFGDSVLPALERGILAGHDLIVFGNNNPEVYDDQVAPKIVELVKEAVHDGRIPRERIDEAYVRIQALKARLTP